MVKFSQDLFDKICGRISEGESLRSVCRDKDMPSQVSFNNWLNNSENGELVKQYTRACEDRASSIFEEMLDIADESGGDMRETEDGKEIVDHEHIQRAKLRVDTRKWMLGKMQPKKYGDKVQNEHSGPDGGPIESKVWTVEVIKPDNAKNSDT